MINSPSNSLITLIWLLRRKQDKLKAELNGRSYRKALLNDPALTAIIQGRLDGGKVIDAGITVALPKGRAQPAEADGKESEHGSKTAFLVNTLFRGFSSGI